MWINLCVIMGLSLAKIITKIITKLGIWEIVYNRRFKTTLRLISEIKQIMKAIIMWTWNNQIIVALTL